MLYSTYTQVHQFGYHGRLGQSWDLNALVTFPSRIKSKHVPHEITKGNGWLDWLLNSRRKSVIDTQAEEAGGIVGEGGFHWLTVTSEGQLHLLDVEQHQDRASLSGATTPSIQTAE